jgi:hypothetical protein
MTCVHTGCLIWSTEYECAFSADLHYVAGILVARTAGREGNKGRKDCEYLVSKISGDFHDETYGTWIIHPRDFKFMKSPADTVIESRWGRNQLRIFIEREIISGRSPEVIPAWY